MKRLIVAVITLAATIALTGAVRVGEPQQSRIRIVPQSSDGLLQDIEESLDGTRLLTHDRGFAPRLWDAKRQILLAVLSNHPDQVFQVNFSSGGAFVVTASARMLQVWDSTKAQPLSWATPPAQDVGIWCAAFSPDELQLAVGHSNGSLTVARSLELSDTREIGKMDDGIWTVVWSPDGSKVLALSRNGQCALFDVENGSRTDLTAHTKVVPWGSFSGDGKCVLTSGQDETAILSEVATGKLIAKYLNAIGERSIANVQMGANFVGRNGDEIECAGPLGELMFYKMGATEPYVVLEGHTDLIREIRRSRDGRYLATYAGDRTLRIWDTFEKKELPFDPEEGSPTAGEFSPHSAVWWLGYSEGEVRKYDVLTGKATRSTFGAVDTLGEGRLYSDQTMMLRSQSADDYFDTEGTGQTLFMRPDGSTSPVHLNLNWSTHSISPNGRYVAYWTNRNESGTTILDTWQNKVVKVLPSKSTGKFTDDSAYFLSHEPDGVVALWECSTGEKVSERKWDTEKSEPLVGVAFHPNGKWVATGEHVDKRIVLWNLEDGTEIKKFDPFPDLISEMKFTPDGKYLLVAGWEKLCVYDASNGAIVTTHTYGEDESWAHTLAFSADSNRVCMADGKKAKVRRVPSLETEFEVFTDSNVATISADGKRVLTSNGPYGFLWDIATKDAMLFFNHPDRVVNIQFIKGERGVVTVDRVGGATVWQLPDEIPESEEPLPVAALAHVVMMKNGDWLVYDDQGRFDAPDPANVVGAYFVLDWEGGLEAISMQQLKAQFYEPGLLGKVLGVDKDPLRDVPELEGIHLYPELSVKQSNKAGTYDIECTERDGGGIGTVAVYLNGKQVLTKKSSGYFQFKVSDFTTYLLPATYLPEGVGNTLSVTVSNSAGDLTSAPVEVDVGIPDGLKVPDVKLHALLVGVGDYVGTSTDLKAPPSDAKAMAAALMEVGNRLLPGRVDVQIMTTDTDSAKRPTRTNILEWFKSLSPTSSSGDIVFVFFAGHGVSKIGEQAGYFFLTSEANPGDVTSATIGTGTISGDDLKEMLTSIPANKQIVVLDTCHSGAAAQSLLDTARATSGDYQRAWEAIKDTTGTWLLAGSAADQRSYESGNVDHGLLTYSLLEAIDRATPTGLRETPSGELFVDVERWLNYAANRVESLKTEVGLKGVQRPEFRRSTRGSSFDVGVMPVEKRGFLSLASPKPIVIVGTFEMEQEDPIGLESAVQDALRESTAVKAWFDVQKHPGVFRVVGTYLIDGEGVSVKVYVQKFDEAQTRKTIDTFEIKGSIKDASGLAALVRQGLESRLKGS